MKTLQIAKVSGEHPIDTVARIVGGRKALALAFDVSISAIGNWKERGVPIEQCPALEVLGRPLVTRRELRPDDWQKIWPELAQAPAHQGQAATQAVAQGA